MLDTKHSMSDLTSASLPDLKSGRRLIVLLPHFDFNPAILANRVWEIANGTSSSILFLGLVNEAERESKVRRDVATLSAMLKDNQIFIETEITFGKDWVDTVKSNLRAGDMVVCSAEQRTGSLNKLLSQSLSSKLNAQIYILSDIASQKQSNSNSLSQIVGWIGSIAIILGFFLLQVRIVDFTKDGLRTLFLLISLPIGIGLLWAWNSLFG
jgi:hypothetical protein